MLSFPFQVVMAGTPNLSFFNEQDGKALKKLFADPTLIPTLQRIKSEVRMGILDFSPERVEVVKQLNAAGIPVVAWLLLPKEKGYWFHGRNAKNAFARYEEIKNWADKSGLKFSGIGIDLELDFNDIDLAKNHKIELLGKIIRRMYDNEGFAKSKKDYESLVNLIRKDGYKVESYYVPLIKEETKDGRSSIQQVSGFLDLTTDKDIPMLYTSFMGNAYGMIERMAVEEKLKFVALGSTGGGIDPTLKSMTWDDLAYDLRHVAGTAQEIHIFSLEGAVEKGFLPKLIDFDYSVPIKKAPEQLKEVDSLKSTVAMISKLMSYPTLLIIGTFLIVSGFIYLIYRVLKFLLSFSKS